MIPKPRITSFVFSLLIGLSLPWGKAGAESLSDFHVAKGLSCATCHTETPPSKPVPTSQCQSCHGNYDKLVELTEKLEINPHESHLGEPDCSSCHHAHKPSEVACSGCHDFKIEIKH